MSHSHNESYSRFESPTRARIQQIAAKLSGLQTSIEDEKHARIEAIEHRLRNMDQRVTQVLGAHEKRLLALRDGVLQCEQTLEEEKRFREELSESKAADIASADGRLQNELEQEIKSRKDGEQRLVNVLEEKLRNTLLELGYKEHGQQQQHGYRNGIHQQWDVTRPREALIQERANREDAENRIYGAIERDLQSLYDEIDQECRERDYSQEGLIKSLQEAASRIRVIIDTEKRAREESEEAILALLEETCVKINTAQAL